MQSRLKWIITINTTFDLCTVNICLFRHFSNDVVYIQATLIIKSKNIPGTHLC